MAAGRSNRSDEGNEQRRGDVPDFTEEDIRLADEALDELAAAEKDKGEEEDGNHISGKPKSRTK